MDLDNYRTIFLVVTIGLALVAAAPLLATTIDFQGNTKPFTELILLGPEHKAENFPFNVNTNGTYTIYLDLTNHMGHSDYYLVKMNLRNIDQSVSELKLSQPSSLQSVYEFYASVDDEGTWQTPIVFGFKDVTRNGDIITVGDLVVNDFVIPVDASANWDSAANCFYFQLFFELYRYDVNAQNFVYTEQLVGIWLNMTASQ